MSALKKPNLDFGVLAELARKAVPVVRVQRKVFPYDKAWPVYQILVCERGLSGPAAMAWLVERGAVNAGDAEAAYHALRGRMGRVRRKAKRKGDV